MKILWRLFIYLTLHIVFQHVYADHTELYVSISDTVVMNCRVEYSGSFRWIRDSTTIAQDFVLWNGFQNKKYELIPDYKKRECNLIILNITKEDLGLYVCETQISNTMIFTSYTLKLAEYKSTEIVSTEDNISTENPFFVISTVSHSHRDFKNETLNEKGLFYGETLYYSLSAVGLVLVGYLLILCYAACMNKKCRTVVKTSENVHQDNALNVQVNHHEQIAVVEILDVDTEDYNSHYATINEREMLPNDVHSGIKDAKNIAKQIIENDVKQNKSNGAGNECINFSQTGKLVSLNNTPLETNLDAYKVSYPQEDNILGSDRSSDDGSTTDGYLHPYTTLNLNDIEYLSSYNTLINVDQAIGVEPLKLSDNDNSFFLKKDSVLDENAVKIRQALKASNVANCNNECYTDGYSAKTNSN